MKKTPVYQQIITDIKNQIISGELKPNQKLESDSVYAKRYNVSRNTVIKAFDTLKLSGLVQRYQGGSSYVAAKESIITPKNELAQSNIISLALPLLADDLLHYGEYSLVCGVEQALRKNKFSLLLSNDIEYQDEQASFVSTSIQQHSRGAIIYPTIAARSSVALFNIILDGFPVVFIDRNIGFNNVTCVRSNNEFGGRLAAKHLIERGYTELFFIADSTIDVTDTLRDRFWGFCAEARKFGSYTDNSHLIQGFALKGGVYNPSTYETSPSLFRKLVSDIMSKSNERIGIFACNDIVASSLIQAATDLGISIPESLGIIGFDDADFAKKAPIPITTIKQDFLKIGKVAADAMISILNGEEVPTDISIDVELIARSST